MLKVRLLYGDPVLRGAVRGTDTERAIACLVAAASQAGTKREVLGVVELQRGETDMAQTAYSQFGAEVRCSSKVPEMFATPAPAAQAAQPAPAMRSRLGLCAVVIAIAALLLGGWSWLYVRQYEDTDDLQIDGNMSAVSPHSQRAVTELHIAD